MDSNHELLHKLQKCPNTNQSRIDMLESINAHVRTHDIVTILPDIWKWISSLPDQEDPQMYSRILKVAQSCLEFHFADCDLLRITFYNLVTMKPRGDGKKANAVPMIQDTSFDLKLAVLIALTQDGKSIRHFERDICRLIQEWISFVKLDDGSSKKPSDILLGDEQVLKRLSTCLSFLSKLVKYLFVELLEEDFESVFVTACNIAVSCENTILLTDVLGLFDSVIRYASLSKKILIPFLMSFCHCFSFLELNDQSQPISRILFSSHQSMLAIKLICDFLSEPSKIPAEFVSKRSARGAVHLLTWVHTNDQSAFNPNMFFPPSQFLFVLSNVASTQLESDTMQLVLIAVSGILKQDIGSLSSVDWSHIISILQNTLILISQPDLQGLFQAPRSEPSSSSSSLSKRPSLTELFVSLTLLVVESSKTHNFSVSEKSSLVMFLLDMNHYLPDDMIQLIISEFQSLVRFETYCTDTLLHRFMNAFVFSNHITPKYRVDGLKLCISFSNSTLTEKGVRLANTITNRLLEHLVDEQDPDVYDALLDWVCEEFLSETEQVEPMFNRVILSILNLQGAFDKVIPAFLQNPKAQSGPYQPPDVSSSLRLASFIQHSTELFHRALKMERFVLCKLISLWMTRFLELPGVVPPPQRVQILEFFSSAIIALTSQSNPPTADILHIDTYLKLICNLLVHEPHFEVLKAAFETVQHLIENPCCFQDHLWILADLQKTSCDLIYNEQAGKKLTDLPNNVRKSDIYGYVVRLLTALLGYNHFIVRSQVEDIISSLLLGLNRWPAIARSCLFGLTICLLEVPSIMVRYVTAVLLKISQTTSTSLAIPNLEFLSILARVPELYVNFTESDYKRVFGIVLQYVRTSSTSNVSSLNQYTTQLAYHVLSSWFMCLKMTERRKYVTFIIHFLLPNSTSSTTSNVDGVLGMEGGADVDELTELVLDMMALNTYADCWPRPPPSHRKTSRTSASKSWMIGNSLVSIVFDEPRTASGFGTVVVHRPTGIVSFRVQLENTLQKGNGFDAMSPTSFRSGDSHQYPTTLPLKSSSKEKALLFGARHSRSASMGSIIEDMNIQTSPHSSRRQAPVSAGPLDVDESTKGSKEDLALLLKRSRSMSMTGKILTPTQTSARSLTSSPAAESPGPHYSKESHALDPLFLFQQFSPRIDLQLSWEKHGMFPLPSDDAVTRAISVLDRTPVLDLHKLGILFVGKGQVEEKDILGNTNGSLYYNQFLRCLGKVFRLPNCTDVYTGGLDTSPSALDGTYGLCVSDDQKLAQVIFHVATMMPSYEHDPLFTSKKRHIGNDFVKIIWNESGFDFRLDQIPGQFNYVGIVIKPVFASKGDLAITSSSHFYRALFHVSIQMRPDMPDITPLSDYPKTLTGASLALFVRQIAVHVNMLSQIVVQGPSGYVSNAHERLKQLKRLWNRNSNQI